jgi:hypothetical protein
MLEVIDHPLKVGAALESGRIRELRWRARRSTP